VNPSASNGQPLNVIVGQELHGDSETIGTRESCVDEGLPKSVADRLMEAVAFLTPEEIAAIVAHRVVIEQAKGMLMLIYSIDADKAFDLLKWRSQASNVKLRLLAEQLVEDLLGIARGEHVNIRSVCEELLLTVHERVSPASDAS
jgi:hypothetical protein